MGVVSSACGGGPSDSASATLDGNYSLTFETVDYADGSRGSDEFVSPGQSLLVSLRRNGEGTHALVGAAETSTDRVEVSSSPWRVALDDIEGVSLGAGIETWTRVVLGRRSDGNLNGTFRATGRRTVIVLPSYKEVRAVIGSGRVTPDIEPPTVELPTTMRAFPWSRLRLSFTEPVSKTELEAATVDLPDGLGSSPLGEASLGNVEPLFDSARYAELAPPDGRSWLELAGTLAFDMTSVHDLVGLPLTNPRASVAVSAIGPARARHDMDSLGGFWVDGDAALPASGSEGETLCEGSGCVVLGCEAKVTGLLDVGDAPSVRVRHRVRGQGDPAALALPGVELSFTREGAGVSARVLTPTRSANGRLDESWREDTASIPPGAGSEVGFTLTTGCGPTTTLTWVVDRIGVDGE